MQDLETNKVLMKGLTWKDHWALLKLEMHQTPICFNYAVEPVSDIKKNLHFSWWNQHCIFSFRFSNSCIHWVQY